MLQVPDLMSINLGSLLYLILVTSHPFPEGINLNLNNVLGMDGIKSRESMIDALK